MKLRPGAGASGRAGAFRWLLVLFLLVAGGFLVAAVADRWGELAELRDRVSAYPWRPSTGLLLAAAAGWSAALLLTGAVWTRFFRAAGGRLGYPAGTLAWMATNLGRYIPGKVWQVTGLAVYARRRGDSGALAVSTSVAAQGATLLAGAALAAALLGGDLLASGRIAWRAGLVLGALALFLHPAVIRRFTRLLGRWLGETPEIGRVRSGEVLRLAVGLTAAWALHGVAFWLFLRGLVGGDAPPPGTAVGIFAAAYLAGYAVFVAPAGLVAREGAMAALLAGLTPLTGPVAAAAAVGARLWITVGELAGLAAGWVWARSAARPREAGEERGEPGAAGPGRSAGRPGREAGRPGRGETRDP